jgi:ferrous iron transport protein A
LLAGIENEFQFAWQRATQRLTGGFGMTLDTVPRNTNARVVSVEASEAHGLRLMEMGLVPGASVRVVRSAPLGDPIQVCIRNYHLALRRVEAQAITVALCAE